MRVRTYCFPGCFTRPPGTSTRNHPHEPTTSKPVVPVRLFIIAIGPPCGKFPIGTGGPVESQPTLVSAVARLRESLTAMDHIPPTLPEPVPERPKGFGPIPGLEQPFHRPRHTGTGPREPRPPREHDSFFRRRVAPLGAALIALLAKLKAVLLILGQVKLLATAGHDARLRRCLRDDLGLLVRPGLRGPAARARDGARDRAAPRGDQGQRAHVHSVHGSLDHRALARRGRAGRGAGRAGRPDPRQPRRGRVRRDLADHGARLTGARSRSRASF